MRRIRLFALLLAPALLTACLLFPGSTHVPMRQLEDRLACPAGQRPPVLLVLMQGALNEPEDYLKHGFVAAVRERGIAADIIMADTNYAYVAEGSVVARLHEDVIAPALTRGYRELWLTGISLGAFSALAYASQHDAQVKGLFLIAPYPGTQDVLRPIREAGSLPEWARQSDQDDDEHSIWRWIARWYERRQPPPLWMTTGEEDRFIAGQRMLANFLPEHHVSYLPGYHDWPVWEQAWRDFLDHGPLAAPHYRQCEAVELENR